MSDKPEVYHTDDRPQRFGLGRAFSQDPRDQRFQLQRPTAPSPRKSRHWTVRGPALDQGPTSMCVAYSIGKYLTCSPVYNKLPDLAQLYREAQQIDEWPGEDYDGTSVRAGFKVLHHRGLVSEYRWAPDAETVAQHVLEHGPVVVGTNWHRDMFTPTREGYITPTGVIDGGHAWLIVGYTRRRRNPKGFPQANGAFRMINSWGPGWGDAGRAWIAYEHLDQLLKAYGEAAVATEVKGS